MSAFVVTLAFGWLLQTSMARIPDMEDSSALILGVGLAALALGVCSGVLGWYLYRQTDRLVAARVEQATQAFLHNLGAAQAQTEEAKRHLLAGYSHWLDRHDVDTAIAHFEHAVRTFPQGLGGYVALGHAYYSRGETDKAFHLLQQALELYPDRKEPYRDMAGLLIREGDLVRALEFVERAVEVDPSVRRDLLEDPLFDALKHEEQTRARYEQVLKS